MPTDKTGDVVDALSDHVDQKLQQQNVLRLQLAATLVTHFDPMNFGRELLDDSSWEHALAVLSESCDEVEYDGAWHWAIRNDVRRDLLKAHYSSEMFNEIRAQTLPPSDDAFAKYLHLGLNGHRLSDDLQSDQVQTRDLNALLKAARLIDLLGIPAADGSHRGKDNSKGDVPSEARKIRRYIEKKSAIDSLGETAGHRLFGRQRDVRALIRYRNANLIDTRNQALRLCVIIGVGGVGKSALLSRYIARQRQRNDQAPVIHFDFDRASLKPDDPLALTFEFTRQLALYVPELDLPLVRYRRSFRTEEALESANRFPGRSLTDALAMLSDILADWPGRLSGVTIVIDTFEEVALQGRQTVKRTLSWLTYLRNLVHLDNLHIIIAGREMPDSILSEHRPHIHSRIRLTDLHKGAARLMLVHDGIDSTVAEKAVDAFGGNPLVLRMFVRFWQHQPKEIDALLADSRNQKRSAPGGKLAITFLLERILVRIPDAQIRQLTSPGLLLRHITADLIKNVLAEPCGLGSLNDEDAQQLFDKLASHVWLVHQEGERLLSHRRDLRRLMLPGIQKNHEKQFEQINRLAVQYYESEPEGVSSEEAWIEAAYHRGFLAENPIPDNIDSARKIITQLGADLMDWPVHTTAMIKQAATADRLTEDERRSLEATHGLISRASQAARLEATDFEEQSETNHDTSDVRTENNEQLITAWLCPDRHLANTESVRQSFKTGRFDHISPLAAHVLKPLFRQSDALAVTHYWQDETLIKSAPWLAALSVMAEFDKHSDTVQVIPSIALDAVQSTPRRVGMETTFELFYMLAIAHLMQDHLAVNSLGSFLKSHLPCFAPPIAHASQLQILQLSVKAEGSGNLIGERDIITVTQCEMLRWPSLYQSLSDDSHPDTNTNRQRLEAIRRLLPESGQQTSLAQLQALKNTLKEHAIEVLGPVGLDKLHCLQPILYAPICFVLESVPVQRLHKALLIMAKQSSWWPKELTPSDTFTGSVKAVDTGTLRLVVDTADHCNLLEKFLIAVAEGDDDPLIRDELRLLQRLQTRLNG